jgi:hypothetical protein
MLQHLYGDSRSNLQATDSSSLLHEASIKDGLLWLSVLGWPTQMEFTTVKALAPTHHRAHTSLSVGHQVEPLRTLITNSRAGTQVRCILELRWPSLSFLLGSGTPGTAVLFSLEVWLLPSVLKLLDFCGEVCWCWITLPQPGSKHAIFPWPLLLTLVTPLAIYT